MRSPSHTAHFQRLIQVWSNLWCYLFILWYVKASESNCEVTVIFSLSSLGSFLDHRYSEGGGSYWSDLCIWLTLGSPSYCHRNSASFPHRAYKKYISNSESVSNSYSQNCLWTINRVSLKVELKLKSYSRSSQPKCLRILNLELIKFLPPFSTIST